MRLLTPLTCLIFANVETPKNDTKFSILVARYNLQINARNKDDAN